MVQVPVVANQALLARAKRYSRGGGAKPNSWWSWILFGVAVLEALFVWCSFFYEDNKNTLLQLIYADSLPASFSNATVVALPETTTKTVFKRPRILVAFTGPSGVSAKHRGKRQLYERNLDHFIKYGVQCHDRDTIITVGHDYYERYYPKVKAIRDRECTGTGHFVHLVARRSVCYDMETVRLIVSGSVAGVSWNEYDYFVYLNCGVTGPHPKFRDTWLDIYLGRLRGKVHMTGLSVLCQGRNTHIQSMMYAVDRVGMNIIPSRTFDCLDESVKNKTSFINTYERGMGTELLNQGHALAPATLQSGIALTLENVSQCNHTKDIWITKHLTALYQGRMPSLEETIFWKTSRILTPEIISLIGYEGQYSNW